MHKKQVLNPILSILASHVKCVQFLIQYIYHLQHAIWTETTIQAQTT